LELFDHAVKSESAKLAYCSLLHYSLPVNSKTEMIKLMTRERVKGEKEISISVFSIRFEK